MRRATVAVFAVLAMGACGPITVAPPRAAVDTDAVLRLMGRFSAAHACPVSERLALTSAHVTDIRPFDPALPLYALEWSDGLGHEGTLIPQGVNQHRDLAFMASDKPFARWYTIASARPQPGEQLVALGYDFRKQRDAFGERVFTLTLLRIVARHLVTEPTVARGTSGTCVLNARGEVVAVVAAGAPTEDAGEAAVAVGVWGETFDLPQQESAIGTGRLQGGLR